MVHRTVASLGLLRSFFRYTLLVLWNVGHVRGCLAYPVRVFDNTEGNVRAASEGFVVLKQGRVQGRERGRYETPMSDVKRAQTQPRGVFRRERFEGVIAPGSCCVESFCKSGRAKHLGHALYVVGHRCDPDLNTRA